MTKLDTTELMQNDWVQLGMMGEYCKVCSIMPGRIEGVTATGGKFSLPIGRFRGIDLSRDTLLRTDFWIFQKGVYRKVVRNRASFTFHETRRLLVVEAGESRLVHNTHTIGHLHQLQQFFRLYTGQELFVTPLCNKAKEYGQAYYLEKKDKYESERLMF